MTSLRDTGEITFYEELGLDPGATPQQIRDAFRALVRLLHPDQHPDPQLKEIAERQMRKLNRIYAVLSDPDSRRRYDEVMLDDPGPTMILNASWPVQKKNSRADCMGRSVSRQRRTPGLACRRRPAAICDPSPTERGRPNHCGFLRECNRLDESARADLPVIVRVARCYGRARRGGLRVGKTAGQNIRRRVRKFRARGNGRQTFSLTPVRWNTACRHNASRNNHDGVALHLQSGGGRSSGASEDRPGY